MFTSVSPCVEVINSQNLRNFSEKQEEIYGASAILNVLVVGLLLEPI